MSYGDNSGGYGGGAPSGAPVNGTLILVLGILGVIGCAICAPIAWVMGNGAVKTGGSDPQQTSLANIGRILGIVGTVLAVIGIIAWFVFGAAIFSQASLDAARSRTAPSSSGN